MKSITLFLLSLLSINAYGKESSNEKSTSNFRKIQIGVNFSPDICYRTLKNNDGTQSMSTLIAQRNSNEIKKMGFTAGLNFCYNINNSIGIQTGIQYANKGYQTKERELVFGLPDPLNPQRIKSSYNFNFIDIPLKVNFIHGKKKIRFLASAGLNTSILLQAKETSNIHYLDHTDNFTQQSNINYNKINFSAIISTGIVYIINNRMNLRVEPTLRYGISKMIDAPVAGYLYNSGLNISYFVRM